MSREKNKNVCCCCCPAKCTSSGSNRKTLTDATYIFIGFRGSGKSTAIQNIFHIPKSCFIDDEMITDISCKGNLHVVEIKGLKSSVCTEDNARILASVNCYIQNVTPTVLFITARLNDSRFVGDSSEFTLYLKALKSLAGIPENSLSNAILLLTNADRPNIQNSIDARVTKYKQVFYNIFNVIPLCVCIGNSNISINAIENQIREVYGTTKIISPYSSFLSNLRFMSDKYLLWENNHFTFSEQDQQKLPSIIRSFTENMATLS